MIHEIFTRTIKFNVGCQTAYRNLDRFAAKDPDLGADQNC